MKLWMRKIAVVLITIATMGMYTPTALLEVNADEAEDSLSKSDLNENTSNPEMSIHQEVNMDLPLDDTVDYKEYVIKEITEKAKEQTMMKFGPRIVGQVEDEFTETILPAMETVIESIIENAGDEYTSYGITEKPTKGYGERIFHVYDNNNGQDVARFHVRRDNRPLEGYYFNFHYHLSKDGFKEHHEIGEIYWDKNTPPKWMA
ncbi:YpjP family protein [Oceanobacillus salinisoli]|uniref:YpjP family protein n=1 Tax=Oceanobacillus salinisoli TaxID=2678611 RepID=UPI0012E1594F|nr:YpjP family protein [Oceanobacillus salinisoli]